MTEHHPTTLEKATAILFVVVLAAAWIGLAWILVEFPRAFFAEGQPLPGITRLALLTFPWGMLFIFPSVIGAFLMWRGLRRPAWALILIPAAATLALVPLLLWALYLPALN
ncbi:MAG TPA: hypothetical protein ENN42_04090 [Thioalkalivibrio sp.]|nr:hypothetical protein [Thioalkalivibrio sp.]